MCTSASSCSLAYNASHPNPDGQNSICKCNPGFVPSINLSNGALVFTCVCPSTSTSTTYTISGVNLNSCCPANSAPNTTNGVCVCNTGYIEGGMDVSNGIWCVSACPLNSVILNNVCTCVRGFSPK